MRPSRQEREILETFLEEMGARLERLAARTGRLHPGDTPDQDNVNALFRELHSLKGAAHLAGLKEISHTAHALEDALLGASEKGGGVNGDITRIMELGVAKLRKMHADFTLRIQRNLWGF